MFPAIPAIRRPDRRSRMVGFKISINGKASTWRPPPMLAATEMMSSTTNSGHGGLSQSASALKRLSIICDRVAQIVLPRLARGQIGKIGCGASVVRRAIGVVETNGCNGIGEVTHRHAFRAARGLAMKTKRSP